jgi:multicomponent Na+:H+ antiporter subunit D
MVTEVYSILPLVAFLMPWISLIAALTFGKHQKLKKAVFVLGSVLCFGVVLSLLPDILAGKTLGIDLIPEIENLDIRFTVDAMGYYFGLVLTFIWMLATVFSLGYIEHAENRYYTFMALCNSFILGCAFSQNISTNS